MSDWIEWNGGVCPVERGTLVDVKHRNGNTLTEKKALHTGSGCVEWQHSSCGRDIIAYRLHKPEQTAAPLTEQLSAAIDKRDKQVEKAKRHAEKLQQQDAEVQRLIEELSKELSTQLNMPVKIWYVNELDGPGIEIEFWRNDIPEDVDVDDPKTWRKGDVVECIDVTEGNSDFFTVGCQYIFNKTDSVNVHIKEDDEGDGCLMRNHCFRFIRRPS